MQSPPREAKPDESKRPAPFSLRLSFEERQRLERDALSLSLSAYIKAKLFDDTTPKRITRGKVPVKDHQELAQALAMLGASRLPQNMNQLAKAAHIGNLPVGEDIELSLQTACEDIRQMRLMLMVALGLAVGDPS